MEGNSIRAVEKTKLHDKRHVIRVKCIERLYKNGVITGYILEDLYGMTKHYPYDKLLESMKNRELDIVNLKLTSDDKIRKCNNSERDAVILTLKSVCRWITSWLKIPRGSIIYDDKMEGAYFDYEYAHAFINSGFKVKEKPCQIAVELEYKNRKGNLSVIFFDEDQEYMNLGGCYRIHGGLDHNLEGIKKFIKSVTNRIKYRDIDVEVTIHGEFIDSCRRLALKMRVKSEDIVYKGHDNLDNENDIGMDCISGVRVGGNILEYIEFLKSLPIKNQDCGVNKTAYGLFGAYLSLSVNTESMQVTYLIVDSETFEIIMSLQKEIILNNGELKAKDELRELEDAFLLSFNKVSKA